LVHDDSRAEAYELKVTIDRILTEIFALMGYLFPVAFMFNTFAMTAFLVCLGLSGKSAMAAEVGIVQGVTLALFYTFSANARNVILNPSSRISVRSILLARLLLSVPVGIASFYLSVYLGDIGPALAFALVVRRCTEWVGEIHLSEMEKRGDRKFAARFSVLQSVLLLLALGWTLLETSMPLVGIWLWALLPMIANLGFIRQQLETGGELGEAWVQMLPHLGSTAMIGITVYVFRLLILLIVGKQTAGDLYTAFALGGMIGSVFANALGPSLALHEFHGGDRHLPSLLRLFLALWVIAGAALFLLAQFGIQALEWAGKSPLFWGATGLSMVGGVVMVAAQRIRLRLLQVLGGDYVYGPDVLMNILILVNVPYFYYLWGGHALMVLYLVNSTLALLFYASSEGRFAFNVGHLRLSPDRCRLIIAFTLFFPLFFQLTGNVFRESDFIFDSEGSLMRVPLPLSLVACFLGIPLLGGYRRAHLSLGIVFLSFILMLVSSVVSTHGRIAQEEGKLILLFQFLVPMCALVLGQLYEEEDESVSFAKAFLSVLLMVVPIQLLVTWLQGHMLLSPYIYIFSIYQHLEYVPLIFIGGYLVAVYVLWDVPGYKKFFILLAPAIGIYVSASGSMIAIIALIGGLMGFVLYRRRFGIENSLRLALLLVVVTSGSYLSLARNSHMFSEKFALLTLSQMEKKEIEKVLPNVSTRFYYWQHYVNGIVDDGKGFVFGHAERPDRSEFPSAHNYFLDFIYNFGVVALVPLIGLMGYTIWKAYRVRSAILGSSAMLGLAVVVFLLVFVDNFFKVGLRQPYPGILSFFLWAVLISRLSRVEGKGMMAKNV
jgi:hypothetical protein